MEEITMKKLLWFLLSKLDDNWGYSTPLQKRFKVGDKVKISNMVSTHHKTLIPHTPATIINTGRHDYLIQDSNMKLHVVYQFEIY